MSLEIKIAYYKVSGIQAALVLVFKLVSGI